MKPRRPLIVALATAVLLGIGALVLQRWVAQTFVVALVLVVVWFVVVAIAALVLGRTRPELGRAMIVTVAVTAIASAGIGYWTGFRKTEVSEDVAVASTRIPEQMRSVALAPMAGGSEAAPARKQEEPRERGPVEVAAGDLAGADGHAATGQVTVIAEPGGERVLTLTDLDADPGPDVNVYLSTSTDGIDEAVDLGNLKAPVGNQQYKIPADADLNRYSSVVLYCIPFTTRIATAELR